MTIDKDELREWLRANLLIDVERCKTQVDKDVWIGLRFLGEKDAFCFEMVEIPDCSS